MPKNIVKIIIQNERDRDNTVVALASSGYKVWVEVEPTGTKDIHYVVFEMERED